MPQYARKMDFFGAGLVSRTSRVLSGSSVAGEITRFIIRSTHVSGFVFLGREVPASSRVYLRALSPAPKTLVLYVPPQFYPNDGNTVFVQIKPLIHFRVKSLGLNLIPTNRNGDRQRACLTFISAGRFPSPPNQKPPPSELPSLCGY